MKFAPIGKALVAQDGRFLEVNPALCQIVGYSEDELLALDFQAITHPEDLGADLAQVRQVLAGEIETYSMEKRYRHKDGHLVWVQLDVSLVREESGEPRYFISQIQDITERRKLEQDLRDQGLRAESANIAKSRFLANMSHEIRTPLNAITGMAFMIRRGGLRPEQAEELDKLELAARHLLHVINDILDLSKIEADNFELADQSIHLADVAQAVSDLVRGSIKGKHVECRVELPGGLPAVYGDETRLRQALLNYAGNAAKFTEAGEIVLRILLEGQTDTHVKVRFEVQDTGLGIEPEVLPRLFSRFEQADNSRTRKFGGTGLGLAITRRLAQLMGGDAGAESRPGVGSRFWFTAFLRKNESGVTDESVPAQSEAEGLALAKHLVGARILYAEDDGLNREVMAIFLEGTGVKLMMAEDGLEAVRLAEEHAFDLILMDMQMPNMDGLEATAAIRKFPHHRLTPILAVTANAFTEDKEHCLHAGMSGFLTKPFEPDELMGKVAVWLAGRTPAEV